MHVNFIQVSPITHVSNTVAGTKVVEITEELVDQQPHPRVGLPQSDREQLNIQFVLRFGLLFMKDKACLIMVLKTSRKNIGWVFFH